VADQNKLSRRRFVQSVAATAGAAAIPSYVSAQAALAQTPVPAAPLSLRNVSPFPGLSARGAGWLRFLWEKATTRDDWSSSGIPHPWWDRYTAPVVLSYGRFDLSYSAYGLLLMADQTPGWREVYTRIADELASRYPTHWGAIDWFTQIGDDPKRTNHSPALMNSIPQPLRGKYNRIGWTANGIQPWGLQPDPIGADGYLFFRAWFLLLLATYKYISGDDKWARPFKVTGYHDETFDWDTHRIAERLEAQYRAHPEGPHCENTKIWVFCNTAGGLGMHLYDKVFGKSTHRAFENFLGYARENYIKVGTDGRLQSVTSYYDPIEKFNAGGGVAGGLMTAHLMQPQNPELGKLLYDAAANALGWRNGTGDVRANTTGLVMAREMGDDVAYERLRAAAEREYEPRFFGDHQEQFGWFFNNKEGFPRGQGSAMLMAAEIAGPGDWTRAFAAPHLDKYAAPTVEGIEFPSVGVSQAWNDVATGTLHVVTYAAAPEKRGASTRWRVTNLPGTANLTVRLNGAPFGRFVAVGPRTIEITSTVDAQQFEIVTGYRGDGTRADLQPPATPRAAATTSLLASTDDAGTASKNPFTVGPGCPCCQSA
jgi:linalool dehydratase/isomerase-like protein